MPTSSGADIPPANATGALHNLVSRLRGILRRAVADGAADVEVLTRPPGYVLDVGTGQIDAVAFERDARQARAVLTDDPRRAADMLDTALSLWRGDAYAEFVDDTFARTEASRLHELRAVAGEDRAAAALELGDADGAIVLAEGLTAQHPLRERLHAQLMLALYRAGRQADALAVYRDHRERLGDALGLDPSAELQRLEGDILRGVPELAHSRIVRPDLMRGTSTTPMRQWRPAIPPGTCRSHHRGFSDATIWWPLSAIPPRSRGSSR